MSSKSVLGFLDDLPGINDDIHYYAPIAVFGYVGYRKRFDLKLDLVPQIVPTQEGVTLTPLELIVLALIFASFTSAIMNKSREMLEILNKDNSYRVVYNTMGGIGLILGSCLLLIHLESLYIIHQQEIYAIGIIGLIVGFYQSLIIFGALSIVATGILEAILSSLYKIAT